MTSARKGGGGTVYTLRERESARAREIIDDICRKQGETFDADPYFQQVCQDPIGVKVELAIKSQIHGGNDPNFFILYLHDDEIDDNNNKKNSGSPLKCSAVVSTGRDQKGNTSYFWPRFRLICYCLSTFFSLGFLGFIDAVQTGLKMFRCGYLAEMAAHLEVDMADCYQLEYLATSVGEIGKGYGRRVMEVLSEMADENKRHVILYSSTKKNVPFYKRLGYEPLRESGEHVTLMIRRYKQQN